MASVETFAGGSINERDIRESNSGQRSWESSVASAFSSRFLRKAGLAAGVVGIGVTSATVLEQVAKGSDIAVVRNVDGFLQSADLVGVVYAQSAPAVCDTPQAKGNSENTSQQCQETREAPEDKTDLILMGAGVALLGYLVGAIEDRIKHYRRKPPPYTSSYSGPGGPWGADSFRPGG